MTDNYKPFDLQKLLDGQDFIVMHQGNRIEAIEYHYFNEANFNHKLTIVIRKNRQDYIICFNDEGKSGLSSDYEIKMKPKTKTLWLGIGKDKIYDGKAPGFYYTETHAYESKEDLLKAVVGRDWIFTSCEIEL